MSDSTTTNSNAPIVHTQLVQSHQPEQMVNADNQLERERIIINTPVTVNAYLAQNSQNENTFAPYNVAHASSESKAITITQHWQQLSSYVAPLKQEVSKLARRWYHLVEKWPRYLAGSTYGSLFFILVKSNHAMNSPHAWGQWKKHMSLQELQRQPQSVLAQDLINDIQNRYINRANPTDSITPLTQFIAQLEQEQTIIYRYLTITSWLEWLWLKKIFPFNVHKIEQAKQAQSRLDFINHVFISWAATHNINKIS